MKFKVLAALTLLSLTLPAASLPSAVKENAGKSENVLIFPASRSIGTLELEGTRRRIQARGRVVLPKEVRCQLVLAFESASDLSPLKRLAPGSLNRLDLSKLEVPNDQFKHIAHLTELVGVNARSTDITDSGLDCFRAMKKLKALNIGETLVTSKGMSKLTGITSLENLHVDSTNVGDDGLGCIASLPKLQWLSVARTHVTDKGMETLSQSKSIINLDIEYNTGITDGGIVPLKKMKQLQELKIANTKATSKCVKDLKQMKWLTAIVYSDNNFTSADISALKKALPKCHMSEFTGRRPIPLEMFAPLH